MAPIAVHKSSLNNHPLGKRKRTLAASLASTDNVDPLAIKRRRHEANAAAASAADQLDDEIRIPSPDPFELTRELLDRDVANGVNEDQSASEGDVDMYMFDLPINVDEEASEATDEEVQEVVEETEEEKLGESYYKSLDEQLTLIILDRLIEEWTSPIYAFFGKIPDISYVNGRCVHEFRCSAQSCKAKGVNKRIVRRYLDTTDCRSTSNLKHHATMCWGAENVERALDAKVDIEGARVFLAGLKDGSLTAAFERTGKGKVSYSHRQHTKAETRYANLVLSNSL